MPFSDLTESKNCVIVKDCKLRDTNLIDINVIDDDFILIKNAKNFRLSQNFNNF